MQTHLNDLIEICYFKIHSQRRSVTRNFTSVKLKPATKLTFIWLLKKL